MQRGGESTSTMDVSRNVAYRQALGGAEKPGSKSKETTKAVIGRGTLPVNMRKAFHRELCHKF